MIARAAPPRLEALRTAVDWCNLWVDREVPGWSDLVVADSLLLDGADGQISLDRASGRGRLGDGQAIFSGHGLRVALTDPSRADRSRGVYHGAISVQGLACSTAWDGLAAVDALVERVTRAIWGDGADLDDALVPGRIDVCTDVAVHASSDAAVDWWDREVYAYGNLDDATALFSTRARARRKKLAASGPVSGARIVGDRRARTLYVGRDPQLRIYPKSRDPQRDVALVKERWVERGWSAETAPEVLRVETQVSREWLSAQRLERADGTALACESLSWSELRPWLPVVAREALSRHRHTDYSDRRARARQRRDSALWRCVQGSVDRWERWLADCDGAESVAQWRGIGELVSIARTTSELRLRRSIESAAARLHLAAAHHGSTHGPAELAWQVVEAALRGEGVHSVEKLDAIRAEYARRLSYPEPRSLARGEGTAVRPAIGLASAPSEVLSIRAVGETERDRVVDLGVVAPEFRGLASGDAE